MFDTPTTQTLIPQSAPRAVQQAANPKPIVAREPRREAEPKPSIPSSTNRGKEPVAPNPPAKPPAAAKKDTIKQIVDAPPGRESNIELVDLVTEADGYESDTHEIEDDKHPKHEAIEYIEIMDTPPSSPIPPSSNVPITASARSSPSLKRKAAFSSEFLDKQTKFLEAEELEERRFKRARASALISIQQVTSTDEEIANEIPEDAAFNSPSHAGQFNGQIATYQAALLTYLNIDGPDERGRPLNLLARTRTSLRLVHAHANNLGDPLNAYSSVQSSLFYFPNQLLLDSACKGDFASLRFDSMGVSPLANFLAHPEDFSVADITTFAQRAEAVNQFCDTAAKLVALHKNIVELARPLPAGVSNALNRKIDCAFNNINNVVNAIAFMEKDDSSEEVSDDDMDSSSSTDEEQEDKGFFFFGVYSNPRNSCLGAENVPPPVVGPHYYTTDSRGRPYCVDPAPLPVRDHLIHRRPLHGMWAVPTTAHVLPQLYPLPPGFPSWTDFLVYSEGRYRRIGNALDISGHSPVVILRHYSLWRHECPRIAMWEKFSEEEASDEEQERVESSEEDSDVMTD
ncbi:hypothetical protein C8F04DRAFT_1202827 [Mycena alexandri]|uniref:Uncharacterized protein n=1 Tax=Mycena alexandri TaxID=1745969 RepID=A0AAD6RVU2_9AGAR|nr:hypothetical protein C8F04DRAFT_1202827 [Mycena alexandri]